MPTTPAVTPPVTLTAPVGPTVFLLHRWDAHVDETGLFRTYAAALAALASAVCTGWADVAHRADVPDSPEGLSDAEAVITFHHVDHEPEETGSPETPMTGEWFDAGFEIVEESVAGSEPTEVSLRLASLRVLDSDPSDPGIPAVTYLSLPVRSGPVRPATLGSTCGRLHSSKDGRRSPARSGFSARPPGCKGGANSRRMGPVPAGQVGPEVASGNTYCLDAAGLTVAVYSGPDGYPSVLITPEDHLSGMPITVRLKAPSRPGGSNKPTHVS